MGDCKQKLYIEDIIEAIWLKYNNEDCPCDSDIGMPGEAYYHNMCGDPSLQIKGLISQLYAAAKKLETLCLMIDKDNLDPGEPFECLTEQYLIDLLAYIRGLVCDVECVVTWDWTQATHTLNYFDKGEVGYSGEYFEAGSYEITWNSGYFAYNPENNYYWMKQGSLLLPYIIVKLEYLDGTVTSSQLFPAVLYTTRASIEAFLNDWTYDLVLPRPAKISLYYVKSPYGSYQIIQDNLSFTLKICPEPCDPVPVTNISSRWVTTKVEITWEDIDYPWCTQYYDIYLLDIVDSCGLCTEEAVFQAGNKIGTINAPTKIITYNMSPEIGHWYCIGIESVIVSPKDGSLRTARSLVCQLAGCNKNNPELILVSETPKTIIDNTGCYARITFKYRYSERIELWMWKTTTLTWERASLQNVTYSSTWIETYLMTSWLQPRSTNYYQIRAHNECTDFAGNGYAFLNGTVIVKDSGPPPTPGSICGAYAYSTATSWSSTYSIPVEWRGKWLAIGALFCSDYGAGSGNRTQFCFGTVCTGCIGSSTSVFPFQLPNATTITVSVTRCNPIYEQSAPWHWSLTCIEHE